MSHESDGTPQSRSIHSWGQHSWNHPGFQMTLQFHFQSLCGPDSAGVLDLPKANWITFPKFPHTCNLKTNFWIIWMNLFFFTQTSLIKSAYLLCLTYNLGFLGSVQFHEFALILERGFIKTIKKKLTFILVYDFFCQKKNSWIRMDWFWT